MKFNKINGVLRYLVLYNIYRETGFLYVSGGEDLLRPIK
jgi:hypothetical protein